MIDALSDVADAAQAYIAAGQARTAALAEFKAEVDAAVEALLASDNPNAAYRNPLLAVQAALASGHHVQITNAMQMILSTAASG